MSSVDKFRFEDFIENVGDRYVAALVYALEQYMDSDDGVFCYGEGDVMLMAALQEYRKRELDWTMFEGE